ncbi:MAG: ABC transporter ATP-binding protein, partial [Halohasta sp.]
YPPELTPPPDGCRFAERCPLATEACFEVEPPTVEQNGLETRCHHTDRVDAELRNVADSKSTWQNTQFARQQ